MIQRRSLAVVLGALLILAACGGSAPVATPTSAPIPLVGTNGPAAISPTASGLPQRTAPPTATPGVTARPTATPPMTLPVKITALPATPRGHQAKATIKTAGGAHCTIDVEYASGPSKASGLGPKIAAVSGALSWSWKVGSNTTPGDWPVTIHCVKGSLSGEAVGSLHVT